MRVTVFGVGGSWRPGARCRMIVRSNASDAKDLYLVFELTCTVRKNASSGGKSTFEMGVAWGAIQLQDAIVNKSKRQFVTLKGGTIDEDTEIKPEEICYIGDDVNDIELINWIKIVNQLPLKDFHKNNNVIWMSLKIYFP